MEFSIKEIILLLKKRFFFILLVSFTGVFVFFICNRFVIKPIYTASVQLYVNPNDSNASGNLTELDYAQKVVTTYVNFLQTKVFFQKVLDESNLDYSVQDLDGMMTIHSINNTEIFEISVTTNSPDDSYLLVKAMEKVAPNHIKSIKNTTDISVVDPVVFPTSPSGPNVLINTLLGGILGFIISVAITIMWDILDVNVKNQEELLRKYQLPILGVIPDFGTEKKKNILHPKIKLNQRRIKNDTRNSIRIDKDTKFYITEAYKSLRTNLRFTLRDDGCKKIIICSPVPEDGKSTTSSNIAITISQTGAKVLLIDCDLRKGRLHKFFQLNSTPGLSDRLSGMASINEIINSTSYTNLHVVTMGSIPPNPTELIGSNEMKEFLETLETDYDYIIIDTPPVNVVSDSLSLVNVVDGVILVVSEGKTSYPNINTALSKYEFTNTNILGFVMNRVTFSQGMTKNKYNYYYYGKNNDN